MIPGAAINYLMASVAARSILRECVAASSSEEAEEGDEGQEGRGRGGRDDLSSRLRHYTCGSGRTHTRARCADGNKCLMRCFH